MSNETINGGEEERSFGKSVVYWGIIYAITIPIVAVITGFIVKIVLGMNSPY